MTTLATIKEAIDLPALVQEYIPLRKSGAQWLCLCPWHQETHPSCRVYANHFYCFTCQAHGTAVDFLMQMESIAAGPAIRMLSERTGIPLDGKRTTRAARAYDKQESAFALWWWKRQCQALALRLTAYVLCATEEEADAAGLLWRMTANLKRDGVRALAARCATRQDRMDWEALKRIDDVWLGLGNAIAGPAA